MTPLRKSCIKHAWQARKMARRLERMNQFANASKAREVMRYSLDQARKQPKE